MLEILKFASESWYNLVLVSMFFMFMAYIAIVITESFKPVNIQFITIHNGNDKSDKGAPNE